MKGRSTGKGPPSADLMVCFPSRAHLTLMPNPICSPARSSSETNKRQQNHHHHRQIKKSGGGIGHPRNPLLWAKTKPPMNSEIGEPTSPKVTCAGQIKVVRPNNSSSNPCKNWQSVMEEIERLHNDRKHHKKKKHNWSEALRFLSCLRNIRFDFRCFGSFPRSSEMVTSDDEVEDEDCKESQVDDDDGISRTVFSKWFMVLQENQNNGDSKEIKENFDQKQQPSAPPPNALLLMRCRSAPAKSWLKDREKEEEEQEDKDEDEESTGEDKGKKKKDGMVVMRYNSDFCRISSSNIAKETWDVDGIRDPLPRSRSCKR